MINSEIRRLTDILTLLKGSNSTKDSLSDKSFKSGNNVKPIFSKLRNNNDDDNDNILGIDIFIPLSVTSIFVSKELRPQQINVNDAKNVPSPEDNYKICQKVNNNKKG